MNTQKITWSPQQQAFINWTRNGKGSGILIAVAGAGKTTTILGAIEAMAGQSVVLAYNKKIAEEIKGKLMARGIDFRKAEAGTVHSFGFRAYRKTFSRVRVDDKKVGYLIRDAVEFTKIDAETAQFTSIIAQVVSLAKQRAIGVDTPIDHYDSYLDIIEHFDLLDREEKKAPVAKIIKASMHILRANNAQTEIIDFDDMVYLPCMLRLPVWQYDNVFVDEAQDTNPARRALVKRLVKRATGRVIAVGDPAQAIYGFTGADADSLELIRKEFKAVEMPLTTTYRCPKAVVKFAQQWVSHIQAAETAPQGKVSAETFEALLKRTDLKKDTAILCRVTKPLVKAAFALIRARIGCRIEGREIANGLKKLATRWTRVKTVNALEEQLDKYLAREIEKLTAKGKEEKIADVEDQVETLRVIIDKCREEKLHAVSDVVAYLDDLFGDNVTEVLVLSTIHKAKGREWRRVYWLDRAGTCPSRWAKKEWAKGQEKNLCYVAATRAMEELIELAPQVTAKADAKAA